jgi:predicted AlkP superfamily phosphohydrolase/phosphomutase/tetratricopeptide (TPR) repeat protein
MKGRIRTMADSKRNKVLLIGWDAADWEHINPLLDAGELPTLERLINGGVMGNLATLQPVLSPMLWNSVATGKYAHKHGVHGFIEPDPINGGARPATSYSRSCRALWNMFTLRGLRSNVVGWWASHPAEDIDGVVVTNSFKSVKFDPEKGWTYPAGTFHPQDMAEELAKFCIFPSELTQEHLLPFIPNAAQIDQEQDHRLGQFAKTLAETGSIQAVATALMELEDWDFTAIYFDCIDHLCHGFMRFYPPRHPRIAEEDFEMYKDVIDGAYKFHDMMLERQLQLAGPDTTVILCSDHGFESGRLRKMGFPREPAGPSNDHRDMGILVINGPGIRQDERIYGASLVDIAPTVLSIMGLPIGEDMDGRPLLEIFETIPRLATIPSWDDLPGRCGMPGEEDALSAEQSDELMQQFAALGYIDDPNKDKATAALDAEVEQKYNLARHCMWLQKHDEAIELYRQIVELRPWETRFLAQLAECYCRGGYLRQAVRLLERSFKLEENKNVSVLLTWAKALLGLGEVEAALDKLRQVEQLRVAVPGISLQLGDIYTKLRHFKDAERNLRTAVHLDPEHAMAWQGLSTVHLRRGENAEAADTALKAVGLIHRLPQAHFNLGVALARTGNHDRAIVAFETVLAFRPDFYNAHRWLARLYRMREGGTEKFIQHYAAIERARGEHKAQAQDIHERAEVLFDLPDIPDEQERLDILLRERPDPENPLARVDKTFVLVSGLPRSGTSLMMQMLEAGGLPSQSDGNREADENNPRGYYEWEALKQIGRYRNLLDEEGMDERAIKAVSAVIQRMPTKYKYKVIFMLRPIDEIAVSQRKMLEQPGDDSGDLAGNLERHRDEVLDWLRKAPNMECLLLDYPSLIEQPDQAVAALQQFLGDKLPTHERMSSAVDPALYRNRAAPVTA